MDPITANLMTCLACRGRCASGETCACPQDGKPLPEHYTTGQCPLQKLIAPDAVPVSAPVQLTSPPRPVAPANPRGPGTELKKLLKACGIEPTPTCLCNARAVTMDQRGPDWCLANLDEIVGWLREEHQRRGIRIPFIDRLVRAMVKRAVRNARRAAA